MTIPAIPETRMGRLTFISETLGVPVPDGLHPDLVDDDGAPARDVLLFCAYTGASLDFIYFTDLRPMLRGAFHHAKETRHRKEGEDA